MKQEVTEMVLNGVMYVRKDSVTESKPTGNRAVVVLDRGWIFAGDVTEENGKICLSRAVHVFSWQVGGFSQCVADPKKAKADLRPCANVLVPAASELFRVPVAEDWGMK